MFCCFMSTHVWTQSCFFWPIFNASTNTAYIPFGNSVVFIHSNPATFRGLFPYDSMIPENWFTPNPLNATTSPPNSTPHQTNDPGVFSVFPVVTGETGSFNFSTVTTTGFYLHVYQIASKIEFDRPFTLISQDGDLMVGSSMGLTNNVLDASNVTPTTSPDDANATIFFEAGINQLSYTLFTNNTGADGFSIAFTFPDNCILDIVQNDTAICAGSNLSLFVIFPEASILWSNGDTTSTINITPLQTTVYYVAATYDGVTYNDSVMIMVNQPSLQLVSTSICQGENYLGYTASGIYIDTLNAINGCDSVRIMNLSVKPGSSFTISQTICQGQNYSGYTSSGKYIDTMVAANGCDSIRTIHLTVQPVRQPFLGTDTILCIGDTLKLYPGAFNTYNWSNGSTQSHITVSQPGRHAVVVTDYCGSASDEIMIREANCDIYFPSAFTPNNDGKNDWFRMAGGQDVKEFHMVVYNRWGQKIFETFDPARGWNGSFNGQLQSSASFVWFSEFKRPGNVSKTKMKGTVTLIR